MGDRVSEPEEQLEQLVKDAEVQVKEKNVQGEGEVIKKEELERPMPRITDADRQGDLKSLNRRLERTLYLLVNSGKGGWTWPSSELEKRESLHTVSPMLGHG